MIKVFFFLVVYKDGPPFYHSSFVVIVKYIEEGASSDNSSDSNPFTWTTLVLQNRVAEQCSKVNTTFFFQLSKCSCHEIMLLLFLGSYAVLRHQTT